MPQMLIMQMAYFLFDWTLSLFLILLDTFLGNEKRKIKLQTNLINIEKKIPLTYIQNRFDFNLI